MATAAKPAARKGAAKKAPAKSAASKASTKKPAAKSGGKTASKAAPKAAKPAAKAAASKSPSTAKGGSKTGAKRAANSSFMKPMTPSNELAAVIGNQPQPRTEVTKKLWDYIKSNNLQDASNKRMINADDKLKPIFNNKSQVSMFEMTALVNKHLS